MRTHKETGFTLIELMIVVVVLGIIAAIAIPNYTSMTARSKEASVKANMHKFQMAAEDYASANYGEYADLASEVVDRLPAGFANPFDGAATAWEDRATLADDPAATSGLVSYSDSAVTSYNIKAVGSATSGGGFPLQLVLTSNE